jgi:hypothetical protein
LIVVDVELNVPAVLEPDPDTVPLFVQAVTEVVPVIVDASVASNHTTHPGIVGGTSPPEVKVEII